MVMVGKVGHMEQGACSALLEYRMPFLWGHLN